MNDAPQEPARDLRIPAEGPPPGAPSAARKVTNDDLLVRLRARLWRGGGPPYVTWALVAANVGVFVWMAARGVGWWQPNSQDLIDWGANFGPLARGPEPWRLFASMFLHVGILHLATNMFALWEIGRLSERMFGAVGMAVLYLVSGLCGGVVSIWWHDAAVAAGASGAIFGLLGGVFGATLRGWYDFPVEWKQRLWTGAWRSAVFMAILTYALPKFDESSLMDNAAHFGGLFSGMLVGALLSPPMAAAKSRFRALRALAVGVVGCAAVGWGWSQLPPAIAPSWEGRRFETHYNAIVHDLKKWRERSISDAELLRRIREERLPAWKKLRRDWAELEHSAAPRAKNPLARALPAKLTAAADAVSSALEATDAALQKPSAHNERAMSDGWNRAIAAQNALMELFQ